MRHRSACDQLWYWNRNVEVDFYLPEEKTAIQACYSVTRDITTFNRELDALLTLDKLHPLDRMVIVTFDEDSIHTSPEGKTVEIIPIWKWLLRAE